MVPEVMNSVVFASYNGFSSKETARATNPKRLRHPQQTATHAPAQQRRFVALDA